MESLRYELTLRSSSPVVEPTRGSNPPHFLTAGFGGMTAGAFLPPNPALKASKSRPMTVSISPIKRSYSGRRSRERRLAPAVCGPSGEAISPYSVIHGGRGPGHCPGVHFRRTRPWIQATGEWRAEGSSLDWLSWHVFEQVALMAAEESGEAVFPLLLLSDGLTIIFSKDCIAREILL